MVESERRKALQGAQSTCLLGTGTAAYSWCSTCGVFCVRGTGPAGSAQGEDKGLHSQMEMQQRGLALCPCANSWAAGWKYT